MSLICDDIIVHVTLQTHVLALTASEKKKEKKNVHGQCGTLASAKASAGWKLVEVGARRREPRNAVMADRSNANDSRQRTTLIVAA